MKKTEKIKNNLLLITDINRNVSTVCISLYFRVGSLYENKDNCGITHLTEHMFFRRLNSIMNKELYYRMESIGGAIRGITARQYVCFELTVLSEFADSAFNLMNEFLEDFKWTDNEVKAEKQIILNEIAQVGNSRDELAASQTGYDVFLLPIKGTPDSLKTITAAQVNKWKSEYFKCGNCCFIITGNIGKLSLNEIRKALNSHKPASTLQPVEIFPQTAFNRTSDEYFYDDGDENYADIFIYFDLDFRSLDWTQVMIMFDAFCNGDGSKLSFAMKDELGMIYSLDSEVKEYGKYGSLKISWSIRNDKLTESLKLFFSLLKEFKSGISQNEFDSSVVFSTLNLKKYNDRPDDLNNMYGHYDYIVGIPFSVDDSVNKYGLVSRVDIDSVSQKVFKLENMFIEVDFNKNHIKETMLKETIVDLANNM